MAKIHSIIGQLRHFSRHESVRQLSLDLQAAFPTPNMPIYALLHPSTYEHIDEARIIDFRNRLSNLMQMSVPNEHDLLLTDVCYQLLLELAALRPLNAEDPITQNIIPLNDKIFTSSGHQFHLSQLIEYHNQRVARGDITGMLPHIEMLSNHKFIQNPISNQPFSTLDSHHIEQVAQQKGLRIQFKINPNQLSVRDLAIEIKEHLTQTPTADMINQITSGPGILLLLLLPKHRQLHYLSFIIDDQDHVNARLIRTIRELREPERKARIQNICALTLVALCFLSMGLSANIMFWGYHLDYAYLDFKNAYLDLKHLNARNLGYFSTLRYEDADKNRFGFYEISLNLYKTVALFLACATFFGIRVMNQKIDNLIEELNQHIGPENPENQEGAQQNMRIGR